MIGVSSGSFDDWDAVEAADRVVAAGGTTVDLRVGKGQRWEAQGVEPFLDAGLEVAFLGLSCTLGVDDARTVMARHRRDLARGWPVKVFCAEGSRETERLAVARDLLAALADAVGGPGRVALETHRGHAPVAEVVAWAQEDGTSVVLDSMGLAGVSADPVEDARRLDPHVRFVQVKGFEEIDGRTRHRPLEHDAEWHTKLLAVLSNPAAITVESRAGDLARDVACVARIWGAIGPPDVRTGTASGEADMREWS